MPGELSRADRRTLLDLARAAIRDAVSGDGSLASALREAEITDALRGACGAFVTLKLRADEPGEPRYVLRGCIGTVTSDRPLHETVIDTAPRSALEDPRFSPLTADELPRVRIEISVLTPPRAIADLDEVVIGRDGLELSKERRRAVFLPQVASEQGWEPLRFAEQLALKAGLERDGWRGAALRTFRADVFGEERD